MVTRVKGSSILIADLLGAVSLNDLGPQNTDVTAGINAALLANKPIIIPVGTWLFSGAVLPANAIVIGMGNKSILKLKDGGNAIGFSVGSNCLLKDFVYDGNKINQVGNSLHGFNIVDSVRSVLSGVSATNVKGSGFFVSGTAAEVDIINCEATGYFESGIKVTAGLDISIINPSVHDSDVAATGDGIALASNGNTVTGVVINTAKIKDITGRGIALVGNGARNVSEVAIVAPRITNTTSHGIHAINADSVTVQGGITKTCNGDGIRLEGDVQNCRVMVHTAHANTGYCIREVVQGTTPNNNGFIYSNVAGNGNNVVTKLGAASYVV